MKKFFAGGQIFMYEILDIYNAESRGRGRTFGLAVDQFLVIFEDFFP